MHFSGRYLEYRKVTCSKGPVSCASAQCAGYGGNRKNFRVLSGSRNGFPCLAGPRNVSVDFKYDDLCL